MPQMYEHVTQGTKTPSSLVSFNLVANGVCSPVSAAG